MAITLDVVTRLDERAARASSRQVEQYFDRAARTTGESFDRNTTAAFTNISQTAERTSRQVSTSYQRAARTMDQAANAAGRVRVEQEKYNELITRGNASQAQMVQHTERLASARRAESAAVRQAASANQEYLKHLRSVDDSAASATTSMRGVASTMSLIGGAARSPVVLAALVPALASIANVAVTASGSLLALPGALGAAGAAFGTLTLATNGFSDAIENMSDPEQFAESMRSLSPSAQQAALSIQALMPTLANFKNATQDAFFTGMGQQINSMATALLPQIQQMTTSVASSFNQMFMGATNTLMNSPAISGITANIATAFQNLAPAAASLTTAFTELVAVGADFLPGLAQGAADAAQSFATFMTEASRSGQLQQWIQDGIDVLGMMKDTIVAAGQAISALGTDGKSAMESIKFTVEGVSTAVRIVTGDMQAWNDVIPSIGELFTRMAENFAKDLDRYLLGPMRTAIDIANALGADIQQIPTMNFDFGGGGELQGGAGPFGYPQGPLTASGLPTGPRGSLSPADQWLLADAARGGQSPSTQGLAPGQYRRRDGTIGYAAPPSAQDGIPTAPGATRGGAATLPEMPSVAYSGDPMALLQGMPVNAQLYSAASTVLDSRHQHAQAEAELNALLQSNTATAAQIQDKRNDVARADREAYEAELRLNEAKQSSTEAFANSMKDASSAFGEMGVALDKDLGISKGLAGMADNLVRFLGSLAMAPILGALNGSQMAAGFQPGSAGKGIFGMMAGSGAFGSQFLMAPGMVGQAGGGYGSYGGYPGDAALLANVPSGRYTQEERGDLTQGLADCSSAVEDLVNLMDGRSTAGASMYTGNAAEFLRSRGFMPGMGGPGDMRVGYNQNHMQATLPGGTPFNWGSQEAAARGGVGGTGAFDPAFTDHWYRPVGASPSALGPAPLRPGAAGGPGWAGPTGVPSSLSGGRGESPVFAPRGPGLGAAAGAAGAPNSALKTQAYANPVGGEGFAGVGGLPMAAIQGAIGAAGGAGSMFGGQAGAAAAQMLTELANRTIAFGGQAASIGVSGLLETFMPSGESAESSISNSWAGRIIGGLAGAAPALPNLAGQAAPPDKKPEGQQQGQPGQVGPDGKQIGVNIEKYEVTRGEDRAGQDLARHQGAAATAGKQPWGGGP